ncbi:hypothetical protein EV715DRAFT_268416 [Schizophyllum commune]
MRDARASFADFIGFRRLRSGKVFCDYYIVPDPDFDLDALGLAAAENERDEPPARTVDEDEGAWEDVDGDPPIPSPPSSPGPRTASLSPLSSLSASPASSRPPSPANATGSSVKNSYAIKGGGRKRRSKAHSRENRRKRRKLEAHGHPERKRRHAQHVVRSTAQRVEFDFKKAPVASTGFRGLYEGEIACTHTLQELLDDGFTYFPYSGRETKPIVAPLAPEPPADAKEGDPPPEPEDVVLGVLAGCPRDGGDVGHGDQVPFQEAHQTLAAALEEQRERNRFTKDARIHRRGEFCAEAEGISHGGGQLQPGRLKHSPAMTLALALLISLPAMIRIAHFASSVFATWAPEIHKYYGDTLAALLASDPTLYRNFPQSVWSCITINFGPQTVTYPHRDYGNLPFGWCAITALGDYDPDVGGHLVLWDCKMVIRFPPGSTIIIPSAIIRHSNTRIAEHEHRYSVTQYTAGAIFRWVEHGFQLDERYYASLTKAQARKEKATAAGRWKRGRAMFAKLSDLVAKAEKAA